MKPAAAEKPGRTVEMRKIQRGLIGAGVVLVVTEWLIVSHSVTWLLTAVLPQ